MLQRRLKRSEDKRNRSVPQLNIIYRTNKSNVFYNVLVHQERELVLKRIAEDRKSLQEKTQTSSETEAPPSVEGQKLGGKVQTNVENNCILMVRL